jgi:hypothetical protein
MGQFAGAVFGASSTRSNATARISTPAPKAMIGPMQRTLMWNMRARTAWTPPAFPSHSLGPLEPRRSHA